MTPRTILELLEQQAARGADQPLFVASGRPPLRYGRFLEHVRTVGAGLRAGGIGPRDRVALALPNGPELAAALLAVSCCACAVPLNPNYTAGELRGILPLLGPRAVVLPGEGPAMEVCRELGLEALLLRAEAGAPVGLAQLGTPEARGTWSEAPAPDDLAVIYHTSGTTARPKVAPISHGNLCDPLADYRAHYGLGPDDRAIGTTPLFHAFGVTVLLTATLACGGSVAFPSDPTPEAVLAGMLEHGATRLAAVPAWLDALADHLRRHAPGLAGSRLRMVHTGSAALNLDTAALLEQRLAAPVLTGYGMSEIGVTLTGAPMPPRRRVAGSAGVLLCGEVAFLGPDGRPVPEGREGELVTRGPGVFRGYEGDPEANAQAFVDGWFRTGDMGRRDAGGLLFITGRVKDVVNRGGFMVAPAEVDRALLRLPGVREAACFPLPHARLGEDLAAAVVLAPGSRLEPGDLRRLLREHLADHKIPNRFFVVEAIPKNDLGKVRRKDLAGLLVRGGAQGGAGRPPAGVIETALAEHWKDALSLERVGAEDDFFALGGDSLQAAILLAEIEARWGVRLPASILMESGSLAGLAARIGEGLAGLNPVVCIQAEGVLPPLFCLHALDGDVMQYRGLKHYCGARFPIHAIRFDKARWEADRGLDIPQLAAHYVSLVRSVRPRGPYHLLGHSLGGLLAFEMAQQLRAAGEAVGLVALLDIPRPGWTGQPYVEKLRTRWNMLRTASPLDKGRLIAGFLARRVRRFYDRALRRQRSLLELAQTYAPPVYGGDVAVIRAAAGCAAQPDGPAVEPALGWGGHVAGRLLVDEVPGDHATMMMEPNVGQLAALLCRLLEDWDRPAARVGQG